MPHSYSASAPPALALPGPVPFLDQITEPILTFDTTGQVTGANAPARNFLAAGGARDLARPIPPASIWQAWFAGPPPPTTKVRWTITITEPDGRPRRVEGMCSPLYDVQNTLIGLIWIGQTASPATPPVVTEEADLRRTTAALATRIRQQAASNDLGRQALAGLPLDALFQQAVTALAATLEIPYTGLMEYQPTHQQLRFRAGVGWPPADHRPHGNTADWGSPVGTAIRLETTMVIADLARDPRFAHPGNLAAYGVVSGVIALIRTPAQIFGTLAAFTAESRAFTPAEIEFVEMLAAILATAIARNSAEERFAKAFHANPNPMSLVRLADGVLIDVNERWLAAFGGTRATVIGQSEEKAVPWLDPVVWPALQTRIQEEGAIHEVEIGYRRPDGEIGYRVISAQQLELAGEPHALMMSRDVTAYRQAAEALAASEERFAKAFQNNPLAQCLIRLTDGVILDVNAAWSAESGWARDEALGRTLADLQLTPDRAIVETLAAERQAHGAVRAFELWTHTRSPEKRCYLIWEDLIEVAGVPAMLAIMQNITDQREAAAQLQDQYDFLAALTGSLAEGVYAINREGRVNFINPAAEDLLGWPAAQLIGQRMQPRIHFRRADGTPLEAADCAILRVLHTSQLVYIDDDVFVRHDGQLLPVAYTAAPIFSAGEQVGVVVAFRDTTVQKHALATRQVLTARVQTLLAISRAILAAQTPAAIVEAAFAQLPQILPYRGARVVVLRGAGQAPAVLMATGTAGRWPSPGCETAGAGRLADHLGPAGGRLRVPLMVEGLAVGLLELESAATRGFGRSHVTIAQEVADQLAVALQHAQLFDQVAATRTHLQHLTLRLVETQEAERRHLARELHDELGQALTALKLGYQATGHQPDPVAWAAGMADNVALIDEVIAGMRRLAQDLRPPLLDELGLVRALDSYLARQAQRAGLVPQFHSSLRADQITAGLAATCFRVAQEAITNVLRHAQASRLGITLTGDATRLEMTVWDNGRGFDVRAAQARAVAGSSMGLVSMQERVTLVGGTVRIASTPGTGTTVYVQVPLPDIVFSGERGGERE